MTDEVRTPHKKDRLIGLLPSCLVTMTLLLLLIAILLPSLNSRPGAPRTVCASHLRELSVGMMAYAESNENHAPALFYKKAEQAGRMQVFAPHHRSRLPDPNDVPSPSADLWALLRTWNAGPYSFICPMTEDRPDPALEVEAYYDFLTAVHLSYAWQYQYGVDIRSPTASKVADDPLRPVLADDNPYIKGGVTESASADRAGEGRGNSLNHGREDQNVAFADGHVQQMKGPDVGLAGSNAGGGLAGPDNIYTTHLAAAPGDPGQAPTATSCNLGDAADTCVIP